MMPWNQRAGNMAQQQQQQQQQQKIASLLGNFPSSQSGNNQPQGFHRSDQSPGFGSNRSPGYGNGGNQANQGMNIQAGRGIFADLPGGPMRAEFGHLNRHSMFGNQGTQDQAMFRNQEQERFGNQGNQDQQSAFGNQDNQDRQSRFGNQSNQDQQGRFGNQDQQNRFGNQDQQSRFGNQGNQDQSRFSNLSNQDQQSRFGNQGNQDQFRFANQTNKDQGGFGNLNQGIFGNLGNQDQGPFSSANQNQSNNSLSANFGNASIESHGFGQGKGAFTTQTRSNYRDDMENQNDRNFNSNRQDTRMNNFPAKNGAEEGARTLKEEDMFETGVPLGFDYNPTSSFDVVARLCGESRENLNYIERSTGSILYLRGRGSGLKDPFPGRESTDPLQIIVKHSTFKGLEVAEQLVESLMKTVQEEYQEHLENEYKNMENMLGLPHEQERAQIASLDRDRNRDPELQGQRFCHVCDFHCPSDELYRIHCQGALHSQKLLETQQRALNASGLQNSNPVSGFSSYPGSNDRRFQPSSQLDKGEGDRHNSATRSNFQNRSKKQLDRQTVADVKKGFEDLMEKQIQQDNVRKLYIQAENLSAQNKSVYDALPRVPNTPKYCKMCNEACKDISTHLWSKYHRQGYLFKQLKLGIRSFTAMYHDVILPDMDTEGGRRLAITSMDSYFSKNGKSVSPEIDNENFKEMAILNGHCAGYICKICDHKCTNLIPWIQHIMDKDHAKACVMRMVDVGSVRYQQMFFNIPSITKEMVAAVLKEEFDAEPDTSRPQTSTLREQGSSSSGGFGSDRGLYASQPKEEWVGGGDSPPPRGFDYDRGRSWRSRSRSPVSGPREPEVRRRKSRWESEDNKAGSAMMGTGGMAQAVAGIGGIMGLGSNQRPGLNQPGGKADNLPNPGPGLLGPPPNVRQMPGGPRPGGPIGGGPMSGGPMSGGPMSGGPMSGGPMSGGPMGGGPMGGGPMGGGPVGGGPMGGGPMGGGPMGGGPMGVGPMGVGPMGVGPMGGGLMGGGLMGGGPMGGGPMGGADGGDRDMGHERGTNRSSAPPLMGSNPGPVRGPAPPLMGSAPPLMGSQNNPGLRGNNPAAMRAAQQQAVDNKLQMAAVQLQMLQQRQMQQQQQQQGMGGQGGNVLASLQPNDRTLVLQIQQMTGIPDVGLVVQAICTLRSLGPQLTHMLGNLTPQNIQLMLAQFAQQVHPTQQPVLHRLLQAFQTGKLHPAMLKGFQG